MIDMIEDSEIVEDTMPAKDADGVPYCRKHHCRMKCTSGGKRNSPVVYYSCPVPKCEEKGKRIKVRESVVPPKPQACPRCSKPGKPVYCERDEKLSNAAKIILRCPSCSWTAPAMAAPQLAEAQFSRRPGAPVANIGDR